MSIFLRKYLTIKIFFVSLYKEKRTKRNERQEAYGPVFQIIESKKRTCSYCSGCRFLRIPQKNKRVFPFASNGAKILLFLGFSKKAAQNLRGCFPGLFLDH